MFFFVRPFYLVSRFLGNKFKCLALAFALMGASAPVLSQYSECEWETLEAEIIYSQYSYFSSMGPSDYYYDGEGYLSYWDIQDDIFLDAYYALYD